ncbi:MAG: branched-chain amino acid ABC transporter permease [Actinomycetota bacterium]|nr:branched-chain amino acid ABC transporter permease [Actinomycetota bacterium]
MRTRPRLFVSYASEMSLLPTWTQKIAALVFLGVLVLLPFGIIPGLGFLADNDWLKILSRVAIYAIGALGLHILSGLAGQVSLGHAFFMGIGAYTAAVLGGEVGKGTWGLGLPIWIWLPAAGIVAAVVGALIAPTAVRVRGIYLAIVTLGLVFVGEWIFRSMAFITGGSQAGRKFPTLEFRIWKEETPLIDFTSDGPWFGVEMTSEAKTYLLLLAFIIVAVIVAKNIQRTRVGRAFMSIRDRDIAAEVMGVAEARNKLVAFALSSAFAGVTGALLGAFIGRLVPETFSLLMSIQFVAILLIGGLGTVTGTLLGSAFVIMLPRLVQDFTGLLASTVETGTGLLASLAGIFVSTGIDDPGIISTLPGTSPGLNVAQFNVLLYGLLLIGFLIFEPLGLYGIWIRIRNYWKSWPFTY